MATAVRTVRDAVAGATAALESAGCDTPRLDAEVLIADERPDLRVTASDASRGAIEVARANARRLGLPVEIVLAGGLPREARDADLVVANLPYVTEGEWPGLSPEIVDHEPREALVAG